MQRILQAHAVPQTPCLGVQKHDLIVQHHIVNILQEAVLRLKGRDEDATQVGGLPCGRWGPSIICGLHTRTKNAGLLCALAAEVMLEDKCLPKELQPTEFLLPRMTSAVSA